MSTIKQKLQESQLKEKSFQEKLKEQSDKMHELRIELQTVKVERDDEIQ